MRASTRAAVLCAAGLAGILVVAGPALAEDEERLLQMEEMLRQHDKEMQALRETVADQGERIDSAEAMSGTQPEDLRVYYKEGVRLETADKKFQARFGGRIMVDAGLYDEDSDVKEEIGNFRDGVEFRRARIFVAGRIHGAVEFKGEYDFAGGDADFKDVYIGLFGLPGVGNLRVGHMKVPFSLEQLTCSKCITFMERGLPNALVPDRRTGIAVFNTELDSLHWALMYFNDTNDFGDGAVANNWAARVAYSWMQDRGKHLIHVGVAALWLRPRDRAAHYSSDPEAHTATYNVVDTMMMYDSDGDGNVDEFDSFYMKRAFQIGLEFAYVLGPLSFQAEWMMLRADSRQGDDIVNGVAGSRDPDFTGHYIYVSYFVTGEHRRYKGGAFDRTRPASNFLDGSGTGAIEIAGRYSFLDLEDKEIMGGTVADYTLGVNWYLNSQTRVMVNYVRSIIRHVGDIDIIEFRFQIDF